MDSAQLHRDVFLEHCLEHLKALQKLEQKYRNHALTEDVGGFLEALEPSKDIQHEVKRMERIIDLYKLK